MLTNIKPGDTVWVHPDRPGELKVRGEVLKILSHSILVRFNNQELHCDPEDLSLNYHPWDTNDGVSFDPETNTFCRRIRSKGDKTLIERYEGQIDSTRKVWVLTERFLEYQSA